MNRKKIFQLILIIFLLLLSVVFYKKYFQVDNKVSEEKKGNEINNEKNIIVEIGGNDGLRGYSIEAFKVKLEDIILLAKNHGSDVMIIGIELPQNYGQGYKQKFRKIYETLSQKHKVSYIHLDYPNDEELMQSDRIHPSPAGHKEIVAQLLPHISRMLCD